MPNSLTSNGRSLDENNNNLKNKESKNSEIKMYNGQKVASKSWPYEKNNNRKEFKSPTKELRVVPSFLNNNEFKFDKDQVKDLLKPSIPIIKVKAMTNTWKVIETTPNSNNNLDKTVNEIENKKWKISRQVPENGRNEFLDNKKTFNDNKYRDNMDNGYTNNTEMIKLKKKKRKKNKSKRRRHHHSSDESDNDNIELDWVERTKETLEMEKINSNG